MVNKILIIIFIVFSCFLVRAQETYLDSTYNLFNGTEYAKSIYKDSNGYTVLGVTKPNEYGFKPCLMKIDKEGKKLYEKTIPDSDIETSTQVISGNFIRDIDGGYLYAGTALHPNGISENSNGSGVKFVKFDSLGDTVFIKQYYNPDTSWEVRSIIQNPDSSYLLVGRQTFTQDNSKMLIIKMNKEGEFVWSKTHGNSSDIRIISSVSHANNGYIVAGYRSINTALNGQITKIDTAGNLLWQKTLPDMGYINKVKELSDGNYIAVGRHIHIHYPANSSFGNCLAVKFSENGNIIWNKNYGKIHLFGSFMNFLELKDGNYIFIGTLGGKEVNSYPDAFILKATPDGDSLWARVNDRCGLMSEERYIDIIEKEDGNFIVAGSFWQGCTPDFWVVGLDSLGCHEQGCQLLSVNEVTKDKIDNEFVIYPNPSEDVFKINTTIADYSIRVFSTTGKLIYEGQNAPNEIDLKKMDSGLYLVEFTHGEQMTRKRIIKR